MINDETLMKLKELGEALLKSPVDIDKIIEVGDELITDYFSFLENIDLIIQKFGFSVDEGISAMGLTKRQYYSRKEDPTLWKREELAKLFKAAKKKKKSPGK